MKNSKHKLRTLIALGVVTLVGVGMISAAPPDFALGRNVQILFNMFREVSLFYVDSVDADEMLEDAAAGMVAHLDPYTELIPERKMGDFEAQTTGKYGGMGAGIRQMGDYVTIAQPYKGSPADKAGLVVGDKILAIDGEDAKGVDVQKISSMLKGTPGTTLVLKVERLLTGEIENIKIKREQIVIPAVSYHDILSDSIGYIVHSDFTEDCSNDIRKAVEELKHRGATALIIDLRSNGGGILQEAVKIMSIFVPKGTPVVSMKGRMKELDKTFKTETEPMDIQMPVAVLVNRSSASSSEIVAGAFQDLDRGVLIGQRSFGKGLVQSPRPLGYNAYLKVTTAKYYVPSGRCIQAVDYAHRGEDGSVGVVPDSLIKEFQTAAGRKVYDGGGIMPDIVTPAEYLSRFAVVLYSKGYIEDFANAFFKANPQGVDVDKFQLSDAEYDRFVGFMQDKDVEFESETQELLKQLRQKAEREKYIDRIATDIDAMEQKIKDDKNKDLVSFKADIVSLLEDEIIMRYHYAQGVTRHNATSDPDVLRAIEVLKDRPQYEKILKTQDTARK